MSTTSNSFLPSLKIQLLCFCFFLPTYFGFVKSPVYSMYNIKDKEHQFIDKIFQQVLIVLPDSVKKITLEVRDSLSGDYKIAEINHKVLCFDYNVVTALLRENKDTANIVPMIAQILLHEISHYMHGDKRSGYACCHYKNEIMNKNSLLIIKQQELLCDLDAYFYARLAGFRVREILPVFYEKIYPQFISNNNLYPSNEERLANIKKEYEKADGLYKIFEFANLAVLIGQYVIADNLYLYIEKQFSAKEIYENRLYCQIKSIEDCIKIKATKDNTKDKNIEERYKDFGLPFLPNFKTTMLSGKATKDNSCKGQIDSLKKTLNAINKFDSVSNQSKITNLYVDLINDIINNTHISEKKIKLLAINENKQIDKETRQLAFFTCHLKKCLYIYEKNPDSINFYQNKAKKIAMIEYSLFEGDKAPSFERINTKFCIDTLLDALNLRVIHSSAGKKSYAELSLTDKTGNKEFLGEYIFNIKESDSTFEEYQDFNLFRMKYKAPDNIIPTNFGYFYFYKDTKVLVEISNKKEIVSVRQLSYGNQ